MFGEKKLCSHFSHDLSVAFFVLFFCVFLSTVLPKSVNYELKINWIKCFFLEF